MKKIIEKFIQPILTVLLITILPSNTFADLNQLVPCKDSVQFHKRLDNTVKKLETRIKKYDSEVPAVKNLQIQIEKTKQRFDKYEEEGLLCGKDGLPHLVADGRITHAKEFVVPGILFIYITGWIGWVGRKYVQYSATTKNPYETEILLDVPYALKSMSTGFIWPLQAWNEFTNGELLAADNDVTVSPR